jgi:hypothetical protein
MTIDFAALEADMFAIERVQAAATHKEVELAVSDAIGDFLDVVAGLSNAQVAHIGQDPGTADGVGWSIGHIVAHATASLEEGCCYSSLLARGCDIPAGQRFRYETPWEEVTTAAQVVRRLLESRHICLAYIGAWPNEPALDNFRKMPEGMRMSSMKMNALGTAIFSTHHMRGHLAQLKDAAVQAIAASS